MRRHIWFGAGAGLFPGQVQLSVSDYEIFVSHSLDILKCVAQKKSFRINAQTHNPPPAIGWQ